MSKHTISYFKPHITLLFKEHSKNIDFIRGNFIFGWIPRMWNNTSTSVRWSKLLDDEAGESVRASQKMTPKTAGGNQSGRGDQIEEKMY